MPNFGLLSQTAQVPMSGIPMQMNTPVENENKRLTMEGKSLDVGEQKRQLSEESQDRDVLKQVLSEQGVDLATPEGSKALLAQAKGKVSPGMYAKLADHSQKIEQNHLKNEELLASKTAEELKTYYEQMAPLVGPMDALDKQYDKTRAEKGQVAAEAELKDGMAKLMGSAGGMKLPSGAPLFPPQLMQNLQGSPPDLLHATIANAKYTTDMVARRYKEAQSKELEARAAKEQAQAEAEKSGKNWDLYNSADGKDQYRYSRVSGRTQAMRGGDWQDISAMPPDVVKPGTAQAAKASAAKDTPALTPDENQFLAELQATTGKQVPGIPAGNGAAATKARTEYLKAFVKMAKDRGYTGDEAGEIALERDAAKEALKRLTTNNAVVVAGEKDLKNVGKLLEEEIKKLGGPQSPFIRKYWNKTATDWEGTPEFTGINAAMANYQETAARVLSGQSGAGGTPVTFLELAKKATGENPNLEQIVKLNDTMNKLFAAREQSFAGARDELLKKVSLKDKSSGETKVSPEDQAKRDKERSFTNQNEYEGEGGLDKARKDLKEVNDGIRAAKDQTSKTILMDQKKRIEGAIEKLGKTSQFKEGDKQKSKSGKDIVYRNGRWEYL